MMMVRPFTLLCLALFALPSQAEIYKYVDENGRVTYTNIPKKGAKKLDLDPGTPSNKSRTNTGPSNFPKIDNQTQRRRDDMRKQILMDELAAEQRLLTEAQKALKDGEAVRPGEERNYQKYTERINKLKDNVALHERNIQALRKELGDIK